MIIIMLKFIFKASDEKWNKFFFWSPRHLTVITLSLIKFQVSSQKTMLYEYLALIKLEVENLFLLKLMPLDILNFSHHNLIIASFCCDLYKLWTWTHNPNENALIKEMKMKVSFFGGSAMILFIFSFIFL